MRPPTRNLSERQLGLKWRPADTGDFPHCLGLIPQTNGVEHLGKTRAVAVWKQLARDSAFQSAVVETVEPVADDCLVGFGSSVFVTEDFARQEIEALRYGLNERVLGGVDTKLSPVLSPKQLKLDNTYEGLNLVVLSGAMRMDILGYPQLAERVLPSLAESFLSCQAGYRLRRVLVEVAESGFRRHLNSMGAWRILDYREPIRESGPRGLAILERRDALEVAGSIPALLFNYQEPRLRLTSAEQEFIRVACSGITDRELCRELGLSKDTIKRRWLTLFDKCMQVIPQLAPEPSGDSKGVRGPQKRHHLLDYIRKHPEETRPFYWPPAKQHEPRPKATTPPSTLRASEAHTDIED